MLFAQENVGYAGRRFECGWPGMPQSAADIAFRVQELARRLSELEPAHGRLRPDPGMRRFKQGDQGPVLELATEELADQIDRGGRSDPPSYPAPVSPAGYDLLYRNDLKGTDPLFVWMSVRAGVYGPGQDNRIGLRPDSGNDLWRSVERGVAILSAMVEAWDPEWACAYALVDVQGSDDEVRSRARPWLAWTARPLKPRPVPPFGRPFPAPFPLDDAGSPAEVRAWHGGELKVWP